MFRPTSKDWPSPHRTLAFAMGAFVLMLVLAYLLFLRPRQIILAKRKAVIQDKTIRFNDLGMPRDPALLEEQFHQGLKLLNGDPEQDFEGLVSLNKNTLAYATQAFTAKIERNYPDTLAFIYGATRLDYKELQERIVAEFGLEDNPDSHPFLADRDDTQAQPVWQTIGKLWTIQDLLDKAKRAGLILASDENGVKRLSAMPIVAYTLQETADDSIFLLEFPVKATFTGTLKQFLTFTESLLSPDGFLPMTRLVVRSTPPEALLPGNKNLVETFEFTVQCSAFMRSGISDIISKDSTETEGDEE